MARENKHGIFKINPIKQSNFHFWQGSLCRLETACHMHLKKAFEVVSDDIQLNKRVQIGVD